MLRFPWQMSVKNQDILLRGHSIFSWKSNGLKVCFIIVQKMFLLVLEFLSIGPWKILQKSTILGNETDFLKKV